MTQPIDTVVTDEQSFNVVDPIDSAPPGSDVEAYVEESVDQLTMGHQVHTVTFATAKASSDYLFDQLVVQNTVDDPPLVITADMITRFDQNGFDVLLNAKPDTGNYYLKWKVRIPTAIQSGITITANTAQTAGGTVKRVSTVTQDGITSSVSSPTELPTITLGLADGGIPLAKLAETVVTGPVLTPDGAQVVTNKQIDGNNNTVTNIGLSSLTGNGIIAQGLADPNADSVLQWNNTNKNFEFVTSANALQYGQVVLTNSANVSTSFRASANTDVARGVALTAAFTAHANGDSIHVGPGVFEVSARLLLKHADLYGSGINSTTIRLGDMGMGASSGPVISFAAYDSDQSVRHIRGILFDCNLQNQSTAAIEIGAVGVQNAVVVEECGAINWGGKIGATENFVFIAASGVAQGGNASKFLNNRIFHPAPLTNMGVTTLFDMYTNSAGSTIDADWTVGFEMAGNVVHDITVGTGVGQPSALHVFSSGQSFGGSIHDNFVYNMYGDSGAGSNRDNTCIYQDAFSARSLSVYNNVFVNVCQPFFVSVASDGRILDNWHVVGNHFDTNTTGNGIGLTVGNTQGFSGWVISNNYIKATDAIALTNCTNFSIENNILDSTTPITLTTCTAITQHNNHKPDGTVVGTPTPWSIAEGGTGAATAAAARTALGIATSGYPTLAGNNIFTGNAHWTPGDGSDLELSPGTDGIILSSANGNSILVVDPTSGALSVGGDSLAPDPYLNVTNPSGFATFIKATNLTANRTHQLPNTAGTLMVGANNLSEITAGATARTNLGMGVQSTTGTTAGFTAGAGTAVLSDSTFTGNDGTKAYTIGDIVKALKTVGLLAAS